MATLLFEQIQLTPQQLQSIQMQLQGKTSAQSIVIQSSQAVQAQPADQMAQLAAASQVKHSNCTHSQIKHGNCTYTR